MAVEFSIYTLTSGPAAAPQCVGRIYAEGVLVPVFFFGPTEVSISETMRAFWKAEVEKVHASEAAREQKIEARKAASAARKTKKSKKGETA